MTFLRLGIGKCAVILLNVAKFMLDARYMLYRLCHFVLIELKKM